MHRANSLAGFRMGEGILTARLDAAEGGDGGEG